MVNTNAAAKRSHGTNTENVEFDVLSSRTLPIPDPTRLAMHMKSRKRRFDDRTVSRYTHADATEPGKRTNDAVAFAWTGAIPARRRAGKTRNVPPPASAL